MTKPNQNTPPDDKNPVAPPPAQSGPAMTRIRTVTAIRFPVEMTKNDDGRERVKVWRDVAPNIELDVPESIAKEFCDRKFKGSFNFMGVREEAFGDRMETLRHEQVRAVRVPTARSA